MPLGDKCEDMVVSFKYICPLFIIISSLFTSCDKENNDFNLGARKCDVAISGFNYQEESAGPGLKTVDIKRQKDTPENIEGYTVMVNNLDNPGVSPISETFRYANRGLNWGRLENIIEGRNEFTARSYGGRKYSGWHDVSYEDKGNREKRLKNYIKQIKENYPLYAVWEDKVEKNIIPNRNNDVIFNMEPVDGGRLAVVIGNRWGVWGSSYILVKVNGYPEKKLNKYRAACLIVDWDYKKLEIVIECWRWTLLGGAKYIKEKTIRIPQDYNIDLRCEKLKNKTRFIDVD